LVLRSLVKNKKGNVFATIYLVGIMMVLLIVGVLVVIGSSILNWTLDEAVPELTSIGMVGDANVSVIAGYGINPVNGFIQSWTWMTGVVYFFALFACIALAFVYRSTGEGWTIALFFGLMVVLILASIFMSNIYEEIYDGNDDLALRLQEHAMLSFFIIHSPLIFSLIGFISGIIIYTGDNVGGIR